MINLTHVQWNERWNKIIFMKSLRRKSKFDKPSPGKSYGSQCLKKLSSYSFRGEKFEMSLKKAKIKSWWLQGWNFRVHSRRRESLSLLLPNLLKTTHTLVHGPFLESCLHILYSDSNLLWLWSSPLTPYLHCLLFMYSWNVFVFHIFLICFTRYILRLFLPQYLTCLFNILMMPFINVNLKLY